MTDTTPPRPELVRRATESAVKKTAEADFGEIVGTHDGEPQ